MAAYTPTGTEILQVLPVQTNGQPAATTVQVTTQQIAALSASGTTSTQVTAINTVGAATLTAANLFSKIISRGGVQTGVFTDTTDTAANIIASLGASAVIGQSYQITYENNTAFNATLAGGTGVTIAGAIGAIIPASAWARFLLVYSGANAVTITGFEAGQNSTLPNSQFLSSGTLTTFGVGQLTGADYNIFANTTGTPGTINTRTAPQMFADIPNASVGQTFVDRIYNNASGTLTIGAGTGVTINGTATVATVTWRDFAVAINSTSTMTFQNIGSGTA